MKKQSVLDRLSKRMAQKECDEWICECGKHNLNGFYNCSKCDKIISEENATKEVVNSVVYTQKKIDAVYENILEYLDTKGLDETVKIYGWDEIKKAIDEESSKPHPRHDEAERLRVTSQIELSDAGVPLDHVLGTVAQHFSPDFKVSIENLEELIDAIRAVVSGSPKSNGG